MHIISPSTMQSFETIRDSIEMELAALPYSKLEPKMLFEPITYILSMGGKRVRPALACMSAQLFSGDFSLAMPIALAVEVYHNFTLLHDDLMDRSSMRRGMETVHRRWGDNAAILSGDGMMVLAYQELEKLPEQVQPKVLKLFNEMALGICKGQQYDIDFEQREEVSEEEYLEMIRLKTAVLLAYSLKMGALVAHASEEQCDTIYRFGEHLGLAFQLEDDLLDVYGDPIIFGKKIGEDIVSNKKTMLLIKAINSATGEDKQSLDDALQMTDDRREDKIFLVTKIYNRLGIRSEVEDLIDFHYRQAEELLKSLAMSDEELAPLRELLGRLQHRKS